MDVRNIFLQGHTHTEHWWGCSKSRSIGMIKDASVLYLDDEVNTMVDVVTLVKAQLSTSIQQGTIHWMPVITQMWMNLN